MKKLRKPPIEKVDYDYNLKEIIVEFFQEALMMLHPELALQVDWSRLPVFLEQELRRLIKAYFKGAKFCDLLVKIWLLDGKETCVLLHWEVETAPRPVFGRRMFEYRTLIMLKHQIDDVAAVVLYSGDKSPNQVDRYDHEFVGTSISYKFTTYKAWEQDEATLLSSPNPFALVVLAIQYVLRTKGKFEDRMLFKEKLFELARQKKMPEQKLMRLVIFVDNFMFLPTEWEDVLKIRLATVHFKPEKMTITQSTRDLAEIMYKAAFGALPQEIAAEEIAEYKRKMKEIRKKVAMEKRRAEEEKRRAEEEKRRAEVAKHNAEEEKRKAEVAKHNAEEEKRKAEVAKHNAEEEKRRAEEEKKERLRASMKMDALTKKSVLAFHTMGLAALDIAAKLELDTKMVEDIIANAAKSVN